VVDAPPAEGGCGRIEGGAAWDMRRVECAVDEACTECPPCSEVGLCEVSSAGILMWIACWGAPGGADCDGLDDTMLAGDPAMGAGGIVQIYSL